MGRIAIAVIVAVAFEAAGMGAVGVSSAAPGPGRRGVDRADTPSPGDAEPRRLGEGPGARRERLGIEERRATAGSEGSSRPLHIALSDPRGCPLDGYPRLVEALLGLENTSALMSLEVWGDARSYRPLQTVIYHLRVPRPAFVSLFWLGPDGGIYVPFHNLRVPANRDVTVDAQSIVVPPLGRERWVALATLEPLANPCVVGEAGMLAAIDGLRSAPHGVGRWEVRSLTGPGPPRP